MSKKKIELKNLELPPFDPCTNTPGYTTTRPYKTYKIIPAIRNQTTFHSFFFYQSTQGI